MNSARRGMSLLEVLAAIGVLSIGLLGLAALLPIGRYTLAEAAKADRAGQCGRAALRDIVARQMLDFHHWYDPGQGKYVYDPAYNGNKPWYDQNGNPTQFLPPAFVIDPVGAAYSAAATGTNPTFGNGGTNVPRIVLDYIFLSPNGQPWPVAAPSIPAAMADSVFRATDDLVVPMPEEATLQSGDPRSPLPVGRPRNLSNPPAGDTNPLDYSDKPLDNAGMYSWFLTVVPQPNNPTRFNVSVVVCYSRNLAAPPPPGSSLPPSPIGERAVNVVTFFDQAAINNTAVAIGGGSVLLGPREINDLASDVTNNTVAGIALKDNEWVALCSANTGLCRWYRVASVGDNTQFLTLIGPDWEFPAAGQDKLVALGQSVVGVYTATIDVDTDPTWKN